MQVILLERVENLGVIGDTVNVRDGFARNFLLPQHKALRATEANKAVFEKRRAEIEANNAEARAGAEKSGKRLDGKSYVLIRSAGEAGQLYGSVSARDIADAISAEGQSVSKGAIILDKPIKTIGIHPVRIRLHAEVSVNVDVNVARSKEEADRQAKGENVITAALEAERAQADEQARDLAANSIANEFQGRDE
jgi:large subunit ribosomal protein L9